jgi:hypothetical protein
MSGGFLNHVVKVFPEGCSCPVAFFNYCNGVLQKLVAVVFLLPLTPPPPSFCTVHSDDVGVHVSVGGS